MGFNLGGLGGLLGGASAPTMIGGTALAYGDSILNNYYNKKAASRQNRYTYGLIDYENEYNLPVNQRARLEEAGYNPNLALSGVNVSSATGSAPSVQPTKFDMATAMLKAYNLEEQNNLLRAQADEAKAREGLVKKQTSSWDHDHASPYKDVIDFLRELLGDDGGDIPPSGPSKPKSVVYKHLKAGKKELDNMPYMMPGGFGNPFALFNYHSYRKNKK